MRCLYDVLEIPRDANDDTIKRAYRQQALKWHPDKNTSAEAEERFKEVSNAFEVLNNPHERAWYDAHRNAILRSDSTHQAGDNSYDSSGDIPNLYEFFTGSCFSGYHSGPKGFYSVYGGVFDEISRREMQESPDRTGVSFGNGDSSDQEVTNFYSYWLSFTSVLDFAFVDEYNPGSAPNRRIRRAMEDQNSKARKAAKKEYVETVRQLALFVKRRDVRVLRIQKEEGERKAKHKAEEEKRRKRAEEERRLKAAEYQDADWITAGEMENEEATHTSDESERNEFWCVVCDKIFKSERAMENHEKSKKHREKVEYLRQELEEEEEEEKEENAERETSFDVPMTHDVSNVCRTAELGVDHDADMLPKHEEEVYESGSDLGEEDFIAQFSGLMCKGHKEFHAPCTEHIPLVDAEELLSESPPKAHKKTNRGKKSRRAKKQAKAGATDEDNLPVKEPAKLCCETCQTQFDSRNQLFKHIRETNHALTKI